MQVSFVIPVRDDQRAVECAEHLVEYVRQRDLDAEILVSGSLGGIPNSIAAKLILVTPPRKGVATRAGIIASTGEIICVCDADMRVPFSDLDRFLREVIDAEVVLGNRTDPDSECTVLPPLRRRITSNAYRKLAWWLFGLNNMDTQCGLKAFQRASVVNLIDRGHVRGFAFDLELVLRARARGLRITSVPIRWHWHPGTTVRLWRAVPEMLVDTILLWAKERTLRANSAKRIG